MRTYPKRKVTRILTTAVCWLGQPEQLAQMVDAVELITVDGVVGGVGGVASS